MVLSQVGRIVQSTRKSPAIVKPQLEIHCVEYIAYYPLDRNRDELASPPFTSHYTYNKRLLLDVLFSDAEHRKVISIVKMTISLVKRKILQPSRDRRAVTVSIPLG